MSSIERYMEGECHVLAAAIHRRMGTEFLLLCEGDLGYRDIKTGEDIPAVHHVYAIMSDGRLLDIRGIHDAENVKSQWLEGQDHGIEASIVEIESEEELTRYVGEGWNLPLTAYSDNDVDEAWLVFETLHPDIIGAHLQP